MTKVKVLGETIEEVPCEATEVSNEVIVEEIVDEIVKRASEGEEEDDDQDLKSYEEAVLSETEEIAQT